MTALMCVTVVTEHSSFKPRLTPRTMITTAVFHPEMTGSSAIKMTRMLVTVRRDRYCGLGRNVSESVSTLTRGSGLADWGRGPSTSARTVSVCSQIFSVGKDTPSARINLT